MPGRVHNFFRKLLGKRAGGSVLTGPGLEEIIPDDIAADYSVIIERVLPYYKNLNESNRRKFLHRVFNFRRIKNFHYQQVPPREEIAILVCASAIQLTFGLQQYLFPYFKDIYILPDAYRYKESEKIYIGHVSPTGIYISWPHFVSGFSDYTDCFNVALHEMAHALHHENFIRQTGIDWEFREDFDKIRNVFGPVISQSIIQKKSYLRGYAFTNFHEFWAVSIEYFFENPSGLKSNLPKLYNIICRTLNQDPLNINEMFVESKYM